MGTASATARREKLYTFPPWRRRKGNLTPDPLSTSGSGAHFGLRFQRPQAQRRRAETANANEEQHRRSPPFEQDDPGTPNEIDEPGPGTAGQEEERTMRPRKTILCVENNEQVLSVRKFLLETRGYRVLAVGTAAEALDHLQRAMPGSIDLLLADLILPLMGGNELVRRAKQ